MPFLYSTSSIKLALLSLLLPLLASCGGGESNDGRSEEEALSCSSLQSAEDALAMLNAARAEPRRCGDTSFAAAPPLSWNAQLEMAADAHANDMATRNFFEHTNPDGVTASQRTTDAGYGPYTGENIGAGYKSLDAAIQGWLKSPGHCANIVNPRYRHYAVACAISNSSQYGIYWTQSFGSRQ